MEIIYKILLGICTTIYTFISWTFQIFIYIAEYNILNPSSYEFITNKIYGILGVIVLFIVAYNILLIIVDPDKNKGGKYFQEVFKKFVTTIILIAVTPWIFNFAYQVQNAILESNVIFKFFMEDQFEYESEELTDYYEEKNKISVAGNEMAVLVFSTFFRPLDKDDPTATCKVGGRIPRVELLRDALGNPIKYMDDNCVGIEAVRPSYCSGLFDCLVEVTKTVVTLGTYNFIESLVNTDISLADAHVIAKATGNFHVYFGFIDQIQEDRVDFDWFLSMVAGCYLLYCIVSFCFDVAVRVSKMAFYYIIAPLCLACRIFPKWESITKTWYKKSLDTFLSVFTRLVILAIGIFVFRAYADSNFAGMVDSDAHFFIKVLGQAFIVMGIVTFIKQAPKLVDEIFGLGKDVKFGIREKFKEGITPPQGIMRGAAALGAGATALVQNRGQRKAALDELNQKYKTSDPEYNKKLKEINKKYRGGAGMFAKSAIRGFNQAHDVKDWRGMFSSMQKGADNELEARSSADAYRRKHGGTFAGVVKGRLGDVRDGVKKWASGQTDERIAKEIARNQAFIESEDNAEKSLISTAVGFASRADSNGIFKIGNSTLDFNELNAINDEYNALATDNTVEGQARRRQLEADKKVAEKKLAMELCKSVGAGKDVWDGFKDGDKKKMADARIAIEKFRTAAAADAGSITATLSDFDYETVLDNQKDLQLFTWEVNQGKLDDAQKVVADRKVEVTAKLKAENDHMSILNNAQINLNNEDAILQAAASDLQNQQNKKSQQDQYTLKQDELIKNYNNIEEELLKSLQQTVITPSVDGKSQYISKESRVDLNAYYDASGKFDSDKFYNDVGDTLKASDLRSQFDVNALKLMEKMVNTKTQINNVATDINNLNFSQQELDNAINAHQTAQANRDNAKSVYDAEKKNHDNLVADRTTSVRRLNDATTNEKNIRKGEATTRKDIDSYNTNTAVAVNDMRMIQAQRQTEKATQGDKK